MCVTFLSNPPLTVADLKTRVTDGRIDSSQDYASRRTVLPLQKTQKTKIRPTRAATKTGNSEILPSPSRNTLFAAVANLDVHLTAPVNAALVLTAQ